MNQFEYRFISDRINNIKKSMLAALSNVSPRGSFCGDIFSSVKSSYVAALLRLLMGRDKTIRRKPAVSLNLDIERATFDEQVISQLFVGFFNNKMTLPMFLIQSNGSIPSPKLIASTLSFLDDIYRHMLTQEQQDQCRLIFKWLKLFFKRLPCVSYKQRQKALFFIEQLYSILGLHSKVNDGGKK